MLPTFSNQLAAAPTICGCAANLNGRAVAPGELTGPGADQLYARVNRP